VPHYPRLRGTQTGMKARVIVRSFVDLYNIRHELAGAREQVAADPLAGLGFRVVSRDAS
jgi:hypothetical protein